MTHPYYVTTAIYYANAAPHIGHAYEIIAADVIARMHRLFGETVFFLTGTDEHGIKVEKTAREQGMTPQAYVDEISDKFKTTWNNLNVTSSRFVRTSSEAHKVVVHALWRQLVAQGDIYKDTYTGRYCSGCEAFLTERDLDEEGHCRNHHVPPEDVEEENYFFKLSKYKQAIIDHIKGNETFILPAFRRNEILNQLEEMEDISVSRAKTSVSWGIPVPDDPEQIIYVWIDALSNYLTGIGWQDNQEQFDTFWPPNVQVIGKDISRFHAIYWPAMLMAANIPLPQTLLVHGFINIAETKISKSIGNVVSVQDLVDRFDLPNVDPIRYYMMTATGFGQDGNYTDDEFKTKVNADLANNLGNLLNRTLNMTKKYCEGMIPENSTTSVDYWDALGVEADKAQIKQLYEQFQFNDAIREVMNCVDKANKFVNDKEPWTLHKEEKYQDVADVLYVVLKLLSQVAIMLSPVIPTMAQDLWEQLGCDDDVTQRTWESLDNTIISGQATQLGDPILPRLDSEIVGAGKKK